MITAKQAYKDVLDYWGNLRELFGAPVRRDLPKVFVFDVDQRSLTGADLLTLFMGDDIKSEIMSSGEFYPSKPSNNTITELLDSIFKGDGGATYFHDWHIITLNKHKQEGYKFSVGLAEEVTHAFTYKEDITLAAKAIHQIKPFGDKLYEMAVETRKEDLEICMSEFFPPIALPHLVNGTNDGLVDAFSSLYSTSGILCRRKRFMDYVAHLPQIAGHRLMEQYGGDAFKIMQEHPDLTKMSGVDLWIQYVDPLLRNGKK